MDLRTQIIHVLHKYEETDPKAAMLSGMSLVAAFLAKHDGSKTITAAAILSAVCEAAEEYDLRIEQL